MKDVVNKLINLNLTISTMESCTGGFLASSITDIPDASKVFSFGAVTYSNDYKEKFGIKKELINTYSVYSKEVALSMAKNISLYTGSDIGVGITGKFNKKDENNLYGNDNEVFIAIVNNKNKKEIVSSYFVSNNSRHENKEEIVNEVINLISNIF